MIGIYKITSPTGLIYIGQSIDIEKRFRQYCNLGMADQPKIFNSFKKHGADKHLFEVAILCVKEDLDRLENYYIETYNSIKKGLNCKGGGHRNTLCPESKLKLSNSLKIANKRPEVKERRAAWQRGRKMSDASKQKMRLQKLGKPGSEGQRKSAIGNNNAQKEPIQIFKNNELIIVVENLYKAAEFVKGDFRNVHRALKTNYKCNGFTFKRCLNEDNLPCVA